MSWYLYSRVVGFHAITVSFYTVLFSVLFIDVSYTRILPFCAVDQFMPSAIVNIIWFIGH